jgi:hypothetical protein
MGLLSNLKVRPNLLLKDDYQTRLYECTAYEIEDVWRRNSNLRDPARLSRNQKDYNERRLFFGDRSVEMDLARRDGLVKSLADQMDKAIAQVEERPDFEEAVELLVATRWATQEGVDNVPGDWETRLRAVLTRDEFRLTPDILSERLALILGESVPERAAGPLITHDGSPPTSPPRLPSGDAESPAGHGNGDGPIRRNGSSPPVGATPGSPLASPAGDPLPELDVSPAHSTVVVGVTAATAMAPSSSGPGDAGLDRIIVSWPTLPAHVKQSIILLVRAAELCRQAGEG